MSPGPAKSFDPSDALLRARDLFWSRGYDGTGIRDVEDALQVGRKSLYDTFGNKRALYLKALGLYVDTVIERIVDGLARPCESPLQNVERVLTKLGRHHGSGESHGCLLGVAMGQAGSDDPELIELLRGYAKGLEDAFTEALRAARSAGELRAGLEPRDAARQLVAVTQGMALLARVDAGASFQRSAVRAALAALRP